MAVLKKLLGKVRGARGIEWMIPVVIAAAVVLALLSGDLLAPVESGTELERRLEKVLGAIEGAGNVRVMVSEKPDVVSAFSAQEKSSAEVQGVLVVAEGAGNIRVRLELTNAVCALLDVELSSIEIVEMRRD